jgi:predicted metal-binding transcription factor (methanogenesis marker protein 9)
MGAGDSQVDDLLTGETNLFPVLFIGGVAAFIIGAMILCCMPTKSTPQHSQAMTDELLREEEDKVAARLAKQIASQAPVKKAKKKNKNKKSTEVSDAALDKSLQSLSKHYNLLDIFERNVFNHLSL